MALRAPGPVPGGVGAAWPGALRERRQRAGLDGRVAGPVVRAARALVGPEARASPAVAPGAEQAPPGAPCEGRPKRRRGSAGSSVGGSEA